MTASGRTLAEMLREEQQLEPGDETPIGDLFEEEPVPLGVFVRDAHYLGNPDLSPIQYDAVRHVEQVLLPETYPGMVEEFGEYWAPVRMVNFADVMWGKGSGKDHICRVISARIAHILMCLRSPQEYFGMPSQDEIHLLNVASTAPQAYRAFYKPLKTMVAKSPWFADKCDPYETSIRYAKQLEAVSGHSEAEAMEGLNLILGVADELSAFRTKAEAEVHLRSTGREPARTAEAIVEMMRTSGRTRFPDTFKVVCISYPRFDGDAIMGRVNAAKRDVKRKGERSRRYYSGPFPTWEVNPRVRGREAFEEDYEEDYDLSRAKYECKPGKGLRRAFRNEDAVHAALGEVECEEEPPLSVSYYWGTNPDGLEEEANVPGWQVKWHFGPGLVPYRGVNYVIHADLAISGDRAGVAMCHVRRHRTAVMTTEAGAETEEPRPVVRMDFAVALEADKGASPVPREVQIRWFRNLVRELTRRGFFITLATADRFESADSLQVLESWGITTGRVSTDLKTAPYDALRDVMYDGRFEGYDACNGLLSDEILGLQRLPNGKIDHLPGKSKDVADAVACATIGAIEEGGDEGDAPERADTGAGAEEFLVPVSSGPDGDWGLEDGAMSPSWLTEDVPGWGAG